MPRTKNPATARPPAAPSAARSAPATAPAPRTRPAPDSPSGAVHAALAAIPGGQATTAVIADAAGIGRAAARDALATLETDGAVTRAKGGKPGIPDTWTLAAPAQAAENPGPGHDEHPAQPGDSPAASDTDGGQASASGSPRPQDTTTPATTGQHHDDGQVGEARSRPGEQEPDPGPDHDSAPAAGSTPQDGTGTSDGGSTAAGDGQPGDPAPDPAVVAEVSGRIEQIQAAASAACAVLAGGQNLRAALGGFDEICEHAAQARRTLKAALAGSRTPAARPGGLRDKILAHLRGHPGQDFTPHEIHKVISHSSGAIANALDTLVKLGHAELGSDKPRKFHLAAADPPPANGTGTAGDDPEPAAA